MGFENMPNGYHQKSIWSIESGSGRVSTAVAVKNTRNEKEANPIEKAPGGKMLAATNYEAVNGC